MGYIEQANLLNAMAKELVESARLEAVARELGVEPQQVLQRSLDPSEGDRRLHRYLETGLRGNAHAS